MMPLTCFNCGVMKECEHCGHEHWEEGVTYQCEDYPLEVQERMVLYHECPECGSLRTEC